MVKRALVLIDIQKDYFADGHYPLVGIEQATTNASQLLNKFRELSKTSDQFLVVHVRHEFAGDPSKAPFFGRGTQGAEIHPNVLNQEGEKLITKNFPNAFLRTDLKQFLDSNGVKDLVIVGAMTHMCVQGTTRAAAEQGYNVVLPIDATATKDLEYKGVAVPAEQVAAAIFATLEFGYATLTTTEVELSKLA